MNEQFIHLINQVTSSKYVPSNKWGERILLTRSGCFSDWSLTNSRRLLAGTWLTGCRTGSSDTACCSFTQYAATDAACMYVWDRDGLCLSVCVCVYTSVYECGCVRMHNSLPTGFLNHHQIKEKPTVGKSKPASVWICASFCCRIPKTLQQPTCLCIETAVLMSLMSFWQPPQQKCSWHVLFPPNTIFLIIY